MKKVKILITLIVAIFISSEVNAQMKIGNNHKVINPNSILEIEHTSKGLLLPRIALSSTISSAPMSAHLAGMIVYNTATTADVSPSFYYNDGTRWIRVGAVRTDTTDVSSDSWRDTTNLYTVTSRKIGIATGKPDTSAILDIAGTTGGVKFPTMTWVQVRSITLPANGLRVFCSNLNTFLTNLGTPASPRWMAELTTDVDTVSGRLPVGTYRTAIGPTSTNVNLIFENLVFTALFSGGNNIPNVRTLTGTTTLLVWASSEWSTSAGSEHSVGSYAVGNGGQWTRNNLSISANTTNQSLHPGLSLAVQHMQTTETNSFIIFSTATNTLYKVNFYTYTVSGTDNTIIGVQKLR
jgi:hypothetical protein